jgi:hypothetical protein
LRCMVSSVLGQPDDCLPVSGSSQRNCDHRPKVDVRRMLLKARIR